jgi:hypothetical protein
MAGKAEGLITLWLVDSPDSFEANSATQDKQEYPFDQGAYLNLG